LANILIRDLPPELEASLKEYAGPRGLSLSEAAVEFMRLGMASEPVDESSGQGVKVGDYLAETLKEALHTTDEADQFIRSHDVPVRKPAAS
jgi:plasmid stability protein